MPWFFQGEFANLVGSPTFTYHLMPHLTSQVQQVGLNDFLHATCGHCDALGAYPGHCGADAEVVAAVCALDLAVALVEDLVRRIC